MASAGKASVLGDVSEVGLAAEAQEAINYRIRPGLGPEKSTQGYTDTSDNYDQHVAAFEYTAPQHAAKTMGELYPDLSQRERVRILDLAAGTGLVAMEMQKLGFRNMDALDPSQGMLDMAAKRGIYGKLFLNYINENRLPIEDGAYDSIVIAGGVGENLIPCRALHEMIRLVKAGGYIVNVMRAEHLTNCVDLVGRMEQLMKQLEAEGRWEQITWTTFPNFLRGKDGLLLVHRVL